jgi:hypothetical protein
MSDVNTNGQVTIPEWTPEMDETYRVLRDAYYKAHPQKTNKGYRHSEETKQVLREKMTGKKHTPLTKATLRWRMLQGWYGDSDSRTVTAKKAVDELTVEDKTGGRRPRPMAI